MYAPNITLSAGFGEVFHNQHITSSVVKDINILVLGDKDNK